MAGNHGDEYEGQIVLGKLIRSLEAMEVRGRIIILPSANFPAAMAGLRTSPLDEGNLNRSFPGDPYGGPTEQIADYIENVLLPQCDFVFDFHSGGSSLTYVPSAMMRRPQTPELLEGGIDMGVPPEGLGSRLDQVRAWLDGNCGADGWALTPSGTRGVLNDAPVDLLPLP